MSGYWKYGLAQQEAVFYVYFRDYPFEGGYVVSAGQETLLEYLSGYRFEKKALDYLATQRTASGKPMFEEAFLRYLEQLKLTCEIIAVAEGSVVFTQAPILRISGPILQCQLLEGAILNIFGFQSLIATKAARICSIAAPDPIMEFGFRRAQGLQAANWASRAAYIGGVTSTSNVAAGAQYGIPLNGTHAHSWVMSFGDEKEAFARYAELMPENCTLLVDTYDSLVGIERAIAIGKEMKQKNKKLRGIRIDSGDLAYLSQEIRLRLDNAALHDVDIIASGNINEHTIASLKQQKAKISAWGIGTHLSTAFDHPALGAVYKLSALKQEKKWRGKMKISSSSQKVSIPGRLQVQRFRDSNGMMVADMIFDQDDRISPPYHITSLKDSIKTRRLDASLLEGEPLLQPMPRPDSGNLSLARLRAEKELKQLHPSIRRLMNPHLYPIGLEETLYLRRQKMMQELLSRKETDDPSPT